MQIHTSANDISRRNGFPNEIDKYPPFAYLQTRKENGSLKALETDDFALRSGKIDGCLDIN